MTWQPQFALFILLVVLPLVSLLMRSPLTDPTPWQPEAPAWREEAATVPDTGELVGTELQLLQGRRYRAELSLPEGVTEADIRPALEAIGFGDVRVVGARAGQVVIEARWTQGDQTGERPEVLTRVWLLPEPPAPAVAAPAPEASQTPAPRPVPLESNGIGAVQSLNDVGARQVFGQAWALERPHEQLSPQAEQKLMSVARHETYYGQGWAKDSPMATSHNWGAIQSGKSADAQGNCPPGTALQKDSRPTPTGQVQFTTCFKVYPDHLSAARDLIRTVYRGHVTSAVLHSEDLDEFALAMRKNYYFGGFCAMRGPSSSPPCAVFTDEVSAAQYADVLATHSAKLASRIGEPLAVHRSGVLGVVPRTAADGSPVYPVGGVGGAGGVSGAAQVGGALLLLVIAGGALAHEKGWF